MIWCNLFLEIVPWPESLVFYKKSFCQKDSVHKQSILNSAENFASAAVRKIAGTAAKRAIG